MAAYKDLTKEELLELKSGLQAQFEEVKAQAEEFDLVILDEIMAACNYQLVSEDAVVQWLKQQKEQDVHDLEVVLTGRNPSLRIQELADYITEMKMIRHPYEKGISARIGIEY